MEGDHSLLSNFFFYLEKHRHNSLLTRGKVALQERPDQRQHTWRGGGMMLWHNKAKGYICPGAAECSASLLRLSSAEASKGAWPTYISVKLIASWKRTHIHECMCVLGTYNEFSWTNKEECQRPKPLPKWNFRTLSVISNCRGIYFF